MTADHRSSRSRPPAGAVPPQVRRRLPAPPPLADRLVRQVAGIDAWNAARRMREALLAAGRGSREDQLRHADHVEALRRTQAAIVRRTAGELGADAGRMCLSGLTAVIAHRHEWFAEKVALLLGSSGVTVIARTDNGPDALGAVVTEQPDVILAGDRLEMMTGDVLLEETRLFAPYTLRTAHAGGPPRSDALRRGVDAVFLRHHPPAAVADALAALVTARHAEHRRA